MKLKAPLAAVEKVQSPSSFYAKLLAHQRSVLITPEHEAFLKEKREREESEREEADGTLFDSERKPAGLPQTQNLSPQANGGSSQDDLES